jgi:Transposase DDE domain
MAQGTSLKAEHLIQGLGDQFRNLTDYRNPLLSKIPIKDFPLSALAIFSLKFPSLLNFEQEMRDKRNFSNLTSLFGIEQVPSDTHMRTVMDKIDTNELKPGFTNLFAKAQRSGALKDFSILGGHYLLAVDGSGYYFSDSVQCEQCIEKRNQDGTKSYYHQMFAGAIVHPDQKVVIPFCPESIQRQDGSNKNDCERSAIKRFLLQFRKDHPKLKTVILTDALHATLPMLSDMKRLNLSYILGVKPGSHTTLFAGLEKWEELRQVRHFTREDEIGDKIKKKRIREYRYTNGILLAKADINTSVNFLEFWETTQWVNAKGQLKEKKVHFSWITDFALYESTCEEIVRAGRTRWKIENETFNTLKNQGYEFEHNFGHGYQNLSTNFACIMMLAFFIDQLQTIGCSWFKKALVRVHGTRTRLWELLKSLYIWMPFRITGWDMFYGILVEPEKWFAEKNTS